MPDVKTPGPPPESGVSAGNVAASKGSAGVVSADDVQKMIDQALSRQRKEFSEQVRQVAGGSPLAPHAAGVGDTIADTWSQYEQGLAQAGNHPDQKPPDPPPEES